MSWNQHADMNWHEKQAVLADYFDRYGPFRFVVETGIWQGLGSCYQFEDRVEVVAIELDDTNAAAGRAAGHDVRTGDSARLLPLLLASRDAPAFFWLDAHAVDDDPAAQSSALVAELRAILAWPHAVRSCVLVDDVRMMRLSGWPSLADLLAQVGATWDIEVWQDILRLTPKTSI